jgi:hypothetical protein
MGNCKNNVIHECGSQEGKAGLRCWVLGGLRSAGLRSGVRTKVRSALMGRKQMILGEQLIAAAGKGNIMEVKRLLAQGADLDFADKHGNTALKWACFHGREGVVELLLKLEAQVNHANHDNYTALHAACVGEHISIAERLLRAGADVSVQYMADEWSKTLTPFEFLRYEADRAQLQGIVDEINGFK